MGKPGERRQEKRGGWGEGEEEARGERRRRDVWRDASKRGEGGKRGWSEAEKRSRGRKWIDGKWKLR